MNRKSETLFLSVAIGCFLAIGFLLLPSTGRDDSHITYWAAHSLSTFGEIVNYSGDRVEQSSSLLLVVILTVLDLIVPITLTELGWLCSVSFGVATIWLSVRLARLFELNDGLYVALIVGTSPYFLYWSFSGMETSLAALVSVYFMLSCARFFLHEKSFDRSRLVHLTASSAVFLLCRPEAGAVAVAWLVALFALNLLRKQMSGDSNDDDGPSFGRLALLGAVVVILTLGIVTFRLLYFAAPLPNPAFAKVGRDSIALATAGIRYFYDQSFHRTVAVPWLASYLCVALVVVKNIGRSTSRAFLMTGLCAYVGAHISFVVLSGGDWMEAGRFLVPIVPVTAVLVATAVGNLRKPLRVGSLMALVVVQLMGVVGVYVTVSGGRPIWAYSSTVAAYPLAREYGFSEVMNNIHLRDVPLTDVMNEVVGIIAQQKSNRVTILSEYGGMVIYHTAREHYPNVRFVDRFGVTSRDVFECRRYPVLVKTSEGVMAPFGDFIGPRQSCGPLGVDIVFTHGSQAPRLRRLGYEPVYRQFGIVNGGLSTPRRRISGEMVIAVSPRWRQAVRGRLSRRRFDWDTP